MAKLPIETEECIKYNIFNFMFILDPTAVTKEEIIENIINNVKEHIPNEIKLDKMEVIDIVFEELNKEGYFDENKNGNITKYSISIKGLNYATYDGRYINSVDYYTKILGLTDKIRNQENELESKQKEMLIETEDMKGKIIEVLGIFVAIFSLISVNATFFNNMTNRTTIISSILCLNGSILLCIIVLLLGINLIIFRSEKKDNKGWPLILLPIIMIIFGIIMG